MAFPEATERLSHGEPTWFVQDKKVFVSFDDHHHGADRIAMTADDLVEVRRSMAQRGMPVEGVADEDLRKGVAMMAEMFKAAAPLNAAQAATIILDGVRTGKWRILVGEDAHKLDEAVRSDPEGAYDGVTLFTVFGN